MKKLYRKGTVHPSPPLVSDHLSFLPAAILTLAAALSQEDKQVLAYLISCSSGDFSGNRRNTHKSTTTNNPPPQTSTFSGAAVDGGVGGEKVLSGNFSGNRRNTQNKSATPISDSGNSGGGCSKGVAAVNGGVGGGVGGGGGAEQVLSGDFSGNWRNTHHKSAKPNSDSGNSGGGCSKGVAAVKGGGGVAAVKGGGGEKVLSGDFSGNRRNTHFKSATPNSVSENSGGGCSKGVAAVNGGVGGGADHVANFNCYCFSCYMSYWVKWDSSPNRQLIHEILDVYEDGLHSKKSNKKERRNRNGSSLKQNGSSMSKNGSTNGGVGSSSELKKSSSELSLNKNGSGSESGSVQSDPVEETSGSYGGGGDGGDEEETGGDEKGSVRKFVSFLGEKIWGVWT